MRPARKELRERRRYAELGDDPGSAILEPPQSPEIGCTNARCIFQHRLENRLQFAGRTADDTEHLGGRGLLLQRLAQLVKQPRVLNGDDGLGSKVLYQLDLLFAERLDVLAINGNCTNRLIVVEHRDHNQTSDAGNLDRADRKRLPRAILRTVAQIGLLDRFARQHSLGKRYIRRGAIDASVQPLLNERGRQIAVYRGGAVAVILA